ncbi:glycosyl hydrolase family 88-domain-containing protein [Boeremia exigua]|uniref:glycosyl hydrolase family 88-domain-containing protein n=1 Tax=Boeremia exigua TaxID=749465 RepID=UPI001E8DDCF2|nr:glycosyl hydrolase family 88-domain-containing protein [Boeremia exigua]KAH6621951.1 glycosyl hydrolase family 88-domain-containing protein [Boeremia exigua]
MAQDSSTIASPNGEQRYHDAMTKEQALQMSAVRTLSDFKRETVHAQLANSKLLSYLDLDERPSFAIHAGTTPTSDGPLELVYSNKALKNGEGLQARITGEQTDSGMFVESAALHNAFKNWLLDVIDECDMSRRGNAYLFEGHLWMAVTMDRYKVVSGVAANMLWSDPGNTKLCPALDLKESEEPQYPPLRADLPSVRSADVNTELRQDSIVGLYPDRSKHGPYDYTFQPPPMATITEHIKYFRDTDWSQTPLGDMSSWSSELRCVINMTLNDTYPAILFWGEAAIMIYNEAYVQLLGVLHPCMGKSARTHASNYWPTFVPLIEHINATGTSFREHDVPLFIDRHGFLEETYWSFQFTPVLDKDGHITSYYHHLFETTKHHLLERRVSSLVELGSVTAHARSFQSFWDLALQTLAINGKDVPFALLYSTGHMSGSDISTISSPGTSASRNLGACELRGCIGVETGHPLAPPTINFQDNSFVLHSYLLEAVRLGKATIVHLADLNLPDSVLADIQWKGYGDACRSLVICPIIPTTCDNAQVEGFVILGINPRRPFDSNYQKFVHVMLRLLATSLASVALFDSEVSQKEKAIENAANLQQQLLNEIEAKEKKFQSFAERCDVAIFIMDAMGRYTYRNRRWYELFEVAADAEDAMQAWLNIVFPEDLPKCEGVFGKLIMEKVPVIFELRTKMLWSPPPELEQPDCGGSQYHKWILCSAYPELGPNDELLQVVGSVTDISKQKWAEGIQRKRTDSALESKKHLEHFIDTTSHEMRNPLSAIMQCADGILSSYSFSDGNVPSPRTYFDLLDQTLDAAQTIAQCAQHMRHIVDDILTISKLDSGLLVITPVDTQPESIVKHAVKMFDSEAKAADVDLVFVVDQSYRDLEIEWMSLDPTRVLQILINLLTNAIKFTRLETQKRQITITLAASVSEPVSTPGGIQFIHTKLVSDNHHLEQDWQQGTTQFVQFSVSDTGRGLTQEQTTSLFKRFSQASPRTHVHYGGSGLGLFISRRLTELQGGSIGLQSEYKKGSTFSFYIKARRVKPAMIRKGSMPDVFPEDIRHRSQKSSLSLPHDPPHIILEVSQEASQSWHHTQTTPGYLPAHDPPTPVEAGPPRPATAPATTSTADGLGLPPPLDLAELKRTKSIPDTLHVLVVEDNLVNQKVLAKQLRNLGCIVSVANHGRESLDFLPKTTRWNHDVYHARSKSRRPSIHIPSLGDALTLLSVGDSIDPPVELSLILMDWEMPIMNGLTAVTKIRELEQDGLLNGRVPVIGVTANVRPQQIETAIQAGMDDVVGKPFRVAELLARMRGIVKGVGETGVPDIMFLDIECGGFNLPDSMKPGYPRRVLVGESRSRRVFHISTVGPEVGVWGAKTTRLYSNVAKLPTWPSPIILPSITNEAVIFGPFLFWIISAAMGHIFPLRTNDCVLDAEAAEQRTKGRIRSASSSLFSRPYRKFSPLKMKYTLLYATGATAAAVANPTYLAWTADSQIRHGVRKTFGYTQATLYEGIEASIALTKNQTLVDWYRSQIDDVVVRTDGSIPNWNLTHYSLDDYRIGNNLLWWYDRTGDAKYKTAAQTIRNQLNRHPQNKEGGFWHRSPIYKDQMWLDGIFMADTFYATWTKKFDNGNATAWNHIVKQFDLIEKYTRNATTGLLVHGYDESKARVWADPVTGAAPNVWSRAVGWYFMSLLEVIPQLPAAHPGKARLTGYFTTLAAALKKTQDKDGGWWLIMNEPYPGKKGNYIESSASAMFTFGLLKGIREGLLKESDYFAGAKKGYELLTKKFITKRADGTLDWQGTVEVGSLNSNGTFEYYISVPLAVNDLKGVGPFMLASYEIETWK